MKGVYYTVMACYDKQKEITMQLTKKQKLLLDFIDGFTKGQGYSPTYREIMQALGYKSVSTVAKHIDNLVAGGQLVKREGEARSLEVTGGVKSVAIHDRLPWWHELEREIARREGADDMVRRQEAVVLRQALEIIRPSGKEASGETLHTD